MTNVYLLDINDCQCDVLFLENELNENIRSIVNKYKISIDKTRSILAWSLLKKYLKEDYSLDLNDTNIYFNNCGKPFIDKEIYFNISHSLNYVALIISDEECGIDIETLSQSKDYDKLANKILNDKEKEDLKEDDEVIKYWTIKEAYYKKVGTGIVVSKLKEENDYRNVESIFINDSEKNKYYLAIATSNKLLCKINKINKI